MTDISPQVPSVVACKALGTCIIVIRHEICLINLCCLQAATTELESQLNDAKTRLAAQENETRKAESKFQFSVYESEKLKTSFAEDKKAWAEEKTALIQHAEKAEAALEEATTELTGLKHRVNQMVSAIFGESPYYSSKMSTYHSNINCHLTDL